MVGSISKLIGFTEPSQNTVRSVLCEEPKTCLPINSGAYDTPQKTTWHYAPKGQPGSAEKSLQFSCLGLHLVADFDWSQ
jgi:hypothetical protein